MVSTLFPRTQDACAVTSQLVLHDGDTMFPRCLRTVSTHIQDAWSMLTTVVQHVQKIYIRCRNLIPANKIPSPHSNSGLDLSTKM